MDLKPQYYGKWEHFFEKGHDGRGKRFLESKTHLYPFHLSGSIKTHVNTPFCPERVDLVLGIYLLQIRSEFPIKISNTMYLIIVSNTLDHINQLVKWTSSTYLIKV